jgi:hypothetical protein
MDNDALDSMDQLKRAVAAGLKRLRGLAPAAIEDRVGRGDTRRMGCVLRPHDADQNVDRSFCVATRQRTDLGDSSCHLFFIPVGLDILARRGIDVIRFCLVRDRRAECDRRKTRLLAIVLRARNELDNVGAHANASHAAIAIKPTSASDIR